MSLSEQRHVRQELRQGLHQFVMHMYQSYLESQAEEEAKKSVVDAIKEQLGLFMASSASDGAKELFGRKLMELSEQLAQADSFDEQSYLAGKIDILESALEILGLT